MAKARKSYNDLEQEIQKLLAQQEALKDEQLEIFLKKFKTEKFKKKLLTIDPVVLKKVAETFISSFDNVVSNTQRQMEAGNQQSTNQQ